jgi:hypothetical protein
MTDTYQLTDEMFARHTVAASDLTFDPSVLPYVEHDDVRPKFDSVAAAIAWTWSLDSGHDEDCGDAQLGNGWHALFRSERTILHTDNSGFVTAWRIEDGKDIDETWAEIEKGARYMDDAGCEGHMDDDHTLMTKGIGEMSYCDGSCR